MKNGKNLLLKPKCAKILLYRVYDKFEKKGQTTMTNRMEEYRKVRKRQFIEVAIVCCIIFVYAIIAITMPAYSASEEETSLIVDSQVCDINYDEGVEIAKNAPKLITVQLIPVEQAMAMYSASKESITFEEVEIAVMLGGEIETDTVVEGVIHGWMDYTADDVELLANIMWAEEGILYKLYYDTEPAEVEEALRLCGSVVLHRVRNQVGDSTTIREVLYDCDNGTEQYASQTKTKIEEGQDIPEIVYEWAEDLLLNGPDGPNNLVFQAGFKQGPVYWEYKGQYFCTSIYVSETEPSDSEEEID